MTYESRRKWTCLQLKQEMLRRSVKEQIQFYQFSESSAQVQIRMRCFKNQCQSKKILCENRDVCQLRLRGFIISCFWLMISIWWGREQMRWLANYRGFTISRFLLPPTVPPPVNQLWMIARHKSWIEMSDRKIFKGWLARRESVIGSSVGQWAHLPIRTPERMVRWSDIPFYSNFNCIVCLIVSFVCLLHELNPNFSLISKLNIQVEASKTKPQN